MKSTLASLLLSTAFFAPIHLLSARGGDGIRDKAPLTALIFDVRDGNEEPVKKAYFENELDFFLDIEAPKSTIGKDLVRLREIGRSIYEKDFANAASLLKSLPRFDDEKKYLQGVLLAAQGQYEPAAEQFRQLIDRRQDISRNLSSLAFLGAARVFHEVGDDSQALYHYTQIRQLDPLFFQSVFEKAWAFYLSGDMNGALGATLSFMSPYFENSFYPEAFIVRAAAFYQLCYFDRASETIAGFKKMFEPLRNQISQLLSRSPDTWLFDEKSLKSIDRRILGGLTAERVFRGHLRAYLGLKREVAILSGTDGATARQSLQYVRAQLAEQTKKILIRMEAELRDQLAQADIIQIEILQTGANVLMGQEMKQNIAVKTIDLNSIDFDEMLQFWPFKKEYWLDELGSYYYGLASACL
jgi:tetratricopeptide (TPR) repeat protein